jgi:hypothetical protein
MSGQGLRCVLKIEWPVLGLVLRNGVPFYDEWQPDRRYWNGRTVVVPVPFQSQ